MTPIIPDRNVNALWLRHLLEALGHSGAQDIVLCSGARSLALCFEVQRSGRFRTVLPHTDERSGAFLAMGMARSTGRPAVIVTTSGSAVANLLPALTEATALRIPLILLTCDKLRSGRGMGYPQTMDHIGACRAFTAISLDLDDPCGSAQAIRMMQQQVRRAIAVCTDSEQRGIVHINIPLEGDKDSTDVARGWAGTGSFSSFGPSQPNLEQACFSPTEMHVGARSDNDLQRIRLTLGLRAGLRGLIVVGAECPLQPSAVSRLAGRTGFPVLADAASGLRSTGVENLVHGFDVLGIRPGIRVSQPQAMIRLGLPPVLPLVENYLLEFQCPTLRIVDRPIEGDYLHSFFAQLVSPDQATLDDLADMLHKGDSSWLRQWRMTAEFGKRLRREIAASLPWGELAATAATCRAWGFDFIHLGNSMPIRNADIFLEVNNAIPTVFSNRGVNGIDGTLGTFLGELAGTGQRGILLVGDQAFLHDLPALAACRALAVNGVICILNNGGGAIFDFLGASALEGYQELVRSIGDIDISAAAACFRLPYHRCTSVQDVKACLRASRRQGGVHILEAVVPPRSLVEQTVMLYDALEEAGRTFSTEGMQEMLP